MVLKVAPRVVLKVARRVVLKVAPRVVLKVAPRAALRVMVAARRVVAVTTTVQAMAIVPIPKPPLPQAHKADRSMDAQINLQMRRKAVVAAVETATAREVAEALRNQVRSRPMRPPLRRSRAAFSAMLHHRPKMQQAA